MGRAPAGPRYHIRKPGCDNLGRLQLQPGRNYTGYRDAEAWTRQIEAEALDAELFKPFNDEPQYIVGVAGIDGKMVRRLRQRLQQQASIRVDLGGATPVHPVALVEGGFPALPAL